jgi:hypothetical protein
MFGVVDAYVEPFAGSAAVFLARPTVGRAETLNDRSGFITNVWRALARSPDAVAQHSDWPIKEADLFARHVALVQAGPALTERLMTDPRYYDAELAAWWIWGASSWIGSGWCAGVGPWSAEDGRVVKRAGGVARQMPKIGAHNANGDTLQGMFTVSNLPAYFARLAARLRDVRVLCGDWERVLSPRITTAFGACGVFLDPPYPGTHTAFYEHGDTDVWHAAQAWAIENGDNPAYRIALCGMDDQTMPAAWRAIRWTRGGGYGSQGTGAGRANASREVIWFNPHCGALADLPLFAEAR